MDNNDASLKAKVAKKIKESQKYQNKTSEKHQKPLRTSTGTGTRSKESILGQALRLYDSETTNDLPSQNM